MRRDVEAAILEATGDVLHGVRARFRFPPELEVFAGHFPGKPILPGMLGIEMVRAVCERALGTRLNISEIERVKFLKEVLPGDEGEVEIGLERADGGLRARAEVFVRGGRVADVRLALRGR
ncbi:MAG: 3-hydroxyacyl-ACP dehydratase FabZ family protein [Planctomycetota bacterium]|jgi:3-hydroxyacyl-[acyl-carrier-protein] dehydratase